MVAHAKQTVWLVEDSPLEARVACHALAGDFDCEVFSTGFAMLEQLAAAPLPSVLILDWELPEMTGVEIARFVRSSRDELSLPILLLTSHRDDADVVIGLSAGANDFVSKPYLSAILLARVKTLARAQDIYRRGVELEAATKTRAEFERQLIGIVSHDLRNPLATILLGAEVLMTGERLDDRLAKSLARIQSAAERGSRMVNDLLDFTQARINGEIPISSFPGDLHAVVRQVAEDMAGTSVDRDIQITTLGDGRGTWDLDRMSQVILNLLGNALKYSPPSSIVSVRSDADADGVTVSVHNLGAPIAGEALLRIFSPMQRATSQLENRGRSIGLGLFIVKHLVEAHGGQISVTSTAAAGTTFSLRVPKQAPAAAAATRSAQAGESAQRA
jgi:signal transduction histidine kinase